MKEISGLDKMTIGRLTDYPEIVLGQESMYRSDLAIRKNLLVHFNLPQRLFFRYIFRRNDNAVTDKGAGLPPFDVVVNNGLDRALV